MFFYPTLPTCLFTIFIFFSAIQQVGGLSPSRNVLKLSCRFHFIIAQKEKDNKTTGSPRHVKSRSPVKITQKGNYCRINKGVSETGGGTLAGRVAREQQSVPSFARTDLLILELRAGQTRDQDGRRDFTHSLCYLLRGVQTLPPTCRQTDTTQRTDRDFYCTSSEIEYFLKERYLKKTKRKKQEKETNANKLREVFFLFFRLTQVRPSRATEEPPRGLLYRKKTTCTVLLCCVK